MEALHIEAAQSCPALLRLWPIHLHSVHGAQLHNNSQVSRFALSANCSMHDGTFSVRCQEEYTK